MIIVPDISFWQDDNTTVSRKVDFQQMKAAGAKGVILRAGQNTWKDPDFDDYHRAARAAGLPIGCYWFYDSRSGPMGQAELCASIVPDVPELGMWGDFEELYGGPYKGWQNFKQFMMGLQIRFPLVGVYTSPGYWMTHRPTGTADLSFFKSFPLWIAHYGVSTPLIPSPWTDWLFWQFTSAGDGIRYGVESREIDLNVFNGDEYKFNNTFDLTTEPQEPGEPPTMATYYRVTASALNIRSGPSADNARLGLLLQGDRIEVTGQASGSWLPIARILRVSGLIEIIPGGWCHNGYCVRLDANPFPVEPPVEPPPTEPPSIAIPDYLIAHFPDGSEKTYLPE